MALEKELACFNYHLPFWLKYGLEGKFALVVGEATAGVYDTSEQAMQAGYDWCALKPFLVKKITAVEEVHRCSRAPVPIVPAPPTVRVRIALIIDDRGKWIAAGMSGESDESQVDILHTCREQIYYIEADLPIPQPQTLRGTVQ
jgi:hypothetical protein